MIEQLCQMVETRDLVIASARPPLKAEDAAKWRKLAASMRETAALFEGEPFKDVLLKYADPLDAYADAIDRLFTQRDGGFPECPYE